MPVMDTFAKRLKTLREEKGISQTELANELGISRGSLSFYENKSRTADIEILYKVSEYFDVTVDYLLGKSNNRTNENAVIGNAIGLSDAAIEQIIYMHKKHLHIGNRSGIMPTEFDVFIRELEEGSISRFCFCLADVIRQKRLLVRNIKDLENRKVLLLEEDAISTSNIDDAMRSEKDNFDYLKWKAYKTFEIFADEFLDDAFFFQEVGAINANNSEAR